MGRAFIETMLGQYGVAVLHFYEANALWINVFVVLYGLVIILSWNNLKQIRKTLIKGLAVEIGSRPEFAGEDLSPKALKSMNIPWESAVAKARFPFVAQQTGIVPRRLNVDTVRAMLSVDDLTGEAVKLFQRNSASKAKTG